MTTKIETYAQLYAAADRVIPHYLSFRLKVESWRDPVAKTGGTTWEIYVAWTDGRDAAEHFYAGRTPQEAFDVLEARLRAEPLAPPPSVAEVSAAIGNAEVHP